MNPERWQYADDPWPLLRHLLDRASERKARLLGVAHTRRALLKGSALKLDRVVDVAERFADGAATTEELEAARAEHAYALVAPAPAAGLIFGTVGNSCSLREQRITACPLIRDIFGNLFRPVALDPAWRAEAVVALSRGMYESRDFAAMPVLADALDDAGRADADILAHCHGSGPHVRGCWVVDLLLGKV